MSFYHFGGLEGQGIGVLVLTLTCLVLSLCTALSDFITTFYTVFRKKTPTDSFFHISMNNVSI